MQEINQINIDAVHIEYHKLVNLYSQIRDLELDIAGIRESLKLEGVSASDVCKFAKAAVLGKKDKVTESAEKLLELKEILPK